METNSKKFIPDLTSKPDIICVQETWLKSPKKFWIPGYTFIRKDRVRGSGGGCGIFVKLGVSFEEIECAAKLESIIIRIPSSSKGLINYKPL